MNHFARGGGRIVDHRNPSYKTRWEASGNNRFNGAYYYSMEIVGRIMPNVATDRNWITVNQPGAAYDHSIVFIHNNLRPERYDWLANYRDLVLVCGVPETCAKVSHLGEAVYLPLSIDVPHVERFKCAKTRRDAYAGRRSKLFGKMFTSDVDHLSGMERDALLAAMAKYERVYAVGRTAIEAAALGCEVLPFDDRYPDPSIWKVVDNVDAAAMLQELLDAIDGKGAA